MRVKTDARRSAIVRAAWEVFREKGFERTVMSEIREKVGGSKGTLYSYFSSKEDLFFAAIDDALSEQADLAFDALEKPGPLRDRLVGFARRYMALRLEDDVVVLDRMLISEAERSDVGIELRSRYITPRRQKLADMMVREMADGLLRSADPERAAAHFTALVEVDLLERRLHGEPGIGGRLVEEAVTNGVDAFLRAYGPVESASGGE